MSSQLIMTAVQAELKDFAKQISEAVAGKISQQDVLIDRIMSALEAMDARLSNLEPKPVRDSLSEGREL